MTAHELAQALLLQPDLPVVINGWGSDEWFIFEVKGIEKENTSFFGPNQHAELDYLEYPKKKDALLLTY